MPMPGIVFLSPCEYSVSFRGGGHYEGYQPIYFTVILKRSFLSIIKRSNHRRRCSHLHLLSNYSHHTQLYRRSSNLPGVPSVYLSFCRHVRLSQTCSDRLSRSDGKIGSDMSDPASLGFVSFFNSTASHLS